MTFDSDDHYESDALCVVCGDWVPGVSWHEVVARTITCDECRRKPARKDPPPPAVCVPARKNLSH